MKRCPTCQSVTDSEDVCLICKTSLVYEPSAHTDEETIVFNRYYAVYLLKTYLFSVLSLLFCAVQLIGWYESLESFCVPIVLFSVLSLVLGASERKIPASAAMVYRKDAYRFFVKLGKYLSAIMAVVIAVLPLWL